MAMQERKSRERFQKRIKRFFETQRLERLTNAPRPQYPKATVIFAGLSRQKFSKGGKVTAFAFLPVFTNLLRKAGFDTVFVSSHKALDRAIDGCSVAIVVLIYGEVGSIPTDPDLVQTLSKAAVVMHHPDIARIISDKRAANVFFSDHGVPMPRLANGPIAEEPVFSNANNDTGAAVYTVMEGAKLDVERYNARFIDTRVRYKGEDYYATVRLMCIGPIVTHTLVRARPVSEGNAKVHGYDTPIDKALLIYLHDRIVDPYMDKYASLAQSVYQAAGPGFYAHDVLLDTTNDEILMSETGFKLDNKAYYSRMSSIGNDLPFLKGFQSPQDVARQSVKPFIELVNSCLSS